MTMPTTKKKKAHLAGIPPSLLDDTTTPRHGLMTLATAASAISPTDPWAINANGTIQTLCARRAAKSRMVQLAVRSIQHAGNTIQQGALLRAIMDHSLMASAREVAKIDSSKDTATIKFREP